MKGNADLAYQLLRAAQSQPRNIARAPVAERRWIRLELLEAIVSMLTKNGMTDTER
jgi:hypothetical protein